MPSLDCFLLGLRKGRETIARRTTSNTVCVVVEGEGTTTIGDDKFDWKPNDVISCPHGAWTSHRARSEEAVVFEITDRDILARLGLLKDEFRN
jgi:gentisate 1,2-dioxygenase